MARTTIAEAALPGGGSPAFVNMNNTEKFTNVLDANDGQATLERGMLIMVQNRGASALTATLVSVADSLGRTNDENLVLAQDEVGFFGPLQLEGWRQSDGYVYIDVDTDDGWFAVLRP